MCTAPHDRSGFRFGAILLLFFMSTLNDFPAFPIVIVFLFLFFRGLWGIKSLSAIAGIAVLSVFRNERFARVQGVQGLEYCHRIDLVRFFVKREGMAHNRVLSAFFKLLHGGGV